MGLRDSLLDNCRLSALAEALAATIRLTTRTTSLSITPRLPTSTLVERLVWRDAEAALTLLAMEPVSTLDKLAMEASVYFPAATVAAD